MDQDRALYSDHLTRTFRLLDAGESDEGPAGGLYFYLADCYPTGKSSDQLRATAKQLRYVAYLADLDADGSPSTPGTPASDFVAQSLELGMSVTHAGHLIARLKEYRKRREEQIRRTREEDNRNWPAEVAEAMERGEAA